MRKTIIALALLGIISTSAFAEDGQIGSTKTTTCPAGQTCIFGQIGSTRSISPLPEPDAAALTVESSATERAETFDFIKSLDVFGIGAFLGL